MPYILAQKLGMTRIFNQDGTAEAVTVLEAGPCTVTQVKTLEKDGFNAVQIGFGKEKHILKPAQGHQANAKSSHKWLREFKIKDSEITKIGDQIQISIFEPGMKVDIKAISRGKGFAGTIKRHHFSRGPETHGSDQHRQPGAIGSGYPERVFKGLRMSGHMGHNRVTVKDVEIKTIQADKNLLVIKGPVPGPNKGLVLVQTAK